MRRAPKLLAKANREICYVHVGATDVAGASTAAVLGGIGGGMVGYFVFRKTIGAVLGFAAVGAVAGWIIEYVRSEAGPINVGALFSRKTPVGMPTTTVEEVSRCITAARASGLHGDTAILNAAWGCLSKGTMETPPDFFTKMFFDCAAKKRDALRAAHPGQALYPSDYDLAVCAMQAAKAMAASRSPIFSTSSTSRAA